jgi:undecaprenyl-diphosphatase
MDTNSSQFPNKILRKNSFRDLFTAIFVFNFGIFIAITYAVVVSLPIVKLDQSFANFLFHIRTPFLAQVFYFITTFANQLTIISLLALALLYLHFKKEPAFFYPLVFIMLGTESTLNIMKFSINRNRPIADITYYLEKSSSFPSGHSATAVAFFGFILYYLTKHISSKNKKALVIFFGALLIIMIAFSRLYLDVHFLTDVLGGLSMGGLWLLSGIVFCERYLDIFPLKKHGN